MEQVIFKHKVRKVTQSSFLMRRTEGAINCYIKKIRFFASSRLNCFFTLRDFAFKNFILLSLCTTLASPALAQEKPPEAKPKEQPPSVATIPYSPDTCEFSIAFPAEPTKEKKCEDGDSKRCYEKVSFTKVFDMAATVNVRVICSPIDKAIYDTYSPEIMEKTLAAMTDRSVVKTFDTSFRDEKELGFKQAGLVGEGHVGQLSTIYIAQLWIGKKSAFSVEAEMIGDTTNDAEQMFSDILRSAHFKETKAQEKKEEKK
jgi:hypothetical protein